MLSLYNAKVYTLDPHAPSASALAIENGRILAVGNNEQIYREFQARGPALDVGGRAVLPGLIDAHLHLKHYALGLQKVDCETSTRAECLERVAERALTTTPGEWVLGHGWNQNEWPESFGSAADLDAVAPHHPVYLTAKSLHAAWANTSALQQAGIGEGSPDPPSGRVGRDADGNPDGILYESAMALVADIIPEPPVEGIAGAIQAAQADLHRMGLTGGHDFDRRDCFAALQVLHAQRNLSLRVVKSIPLESLPQAVELGLRTGFGDDFLRIGPVKAFSDGALGPRTAAMLADYQGEPGNRGLLLLDAEELFEHGRLAVENGLSLAVHAIGDLANHEVLNAYAQLRDLERERHAPTLRHRIEHVQVLHSEDASRLAELDVIASMQPIHAPSDYPAADRYWGERAAYAYAWRTLLELDTRLAFGSDAPVESPNPFWGLHAAVTRQRADGSPGPQGWYPAQRLSLREALNAYTTGAAYAAGLEDRLGRLSPGFLADLLILDTDPFTAPPAQLREIRPLATMVGGEWVFSAIPLNDRLSTAGRPLPAP